MRYTATVLGYCGRTPSLVGTIRAGDTRLHIASTQRCVFCWRDGFRWWCCCWRKSVEGFMDGTYFSNWISIGIQKISISENPKKYQTIIKKANLPSSTERPLGHHGRSCRVPAGPLILLHRQHKFNTAGSQWKFTQLHIRYYRHARAHTWPEYYYSVGWIDIFTVRSVCKGKSILCCILQLIDAQLCWEYPNIDFEEVKFWSIERNKFNHAPSVFKAT